MHFGLKRDKIPWYDRVFPLAKLSQPLKGAFKVTFLSLSKMSNFIENVSAPADSNIQESLGISQKLGGLKYSRLALAIFEEAKKLGLNSIDLRIMSYLMIASKTKVLVLISRSHLSQRLDMAYSVVSASLKKLEGLQIIRWGKYKKEDGIIVCPDLVNSGTPRRMAFKRMLWEKKIEKQDKKVVVTGSYPLRRKKRSQGDALS